MGVILHAVKLIFFQADPSKFGTRWRRATSAKTLIVMGSGGHTAEMVELLSGMDFNHFSPRIYVIAETDETSSQRVRQLETIRKTDTREHDVLFISRSREVHQSWSSTIITTTESLIQSFIILYRENVDLVSSLHIFNFVITFFDHFPTLDFRFLLMDQALVFPFVLHLSL